jgi:hypothetical protein
VPAGFCRTAPNLQRLSGRRIGVSRRCACVLVRVGGDHPAGTRGVLVRPVDRRVTCVIRAPCWWSMRPGMSRRAPPRSDSSGSTPGAYAGQVGHAMIDHELCLPKPWTTGPVHCRGVPDDVVRRHSRHGDLAFYAAGPPRWTPRRVVRPPRAWPGSTSARSAAGWPVALDPARDARPRPARSHRRHRTRRTPTPLRDDRLDLQRDPTPKLITEPTRRLTDRWPGHAGADATNIEPAPATTATNKLSSHDHDSWLAY